MKPLGALADQWPRLNELLDEALSLPAEQRGAWLQALPAEHAPLKETLARLLEVRAGIETGDFLGTLPKLEGAPVAAAGVPDVGAAQPGDEVGPYRLIRELGEGGMGSVWLAERADGQLKRPVALKLPRLAWARGLAERMARERDILATLEHPHIARLYDAGVDALGRPWLALEYVQGRPIDVFAREQALSVRQRVELLLQVCEAVAYAHARLVIHRDLKPSNILVTDQGRVMLLDFGIAKLAQGEGAAAATALTDLAGRALTPGYASPEQIRGDPLGTASDVYSLGVVAYELLAGARPYRLKRGTAAELEEAIASADPPKASDLATDPQAKRAIAGDVDAILNKALKKHAAERYATIVAFREDWQNWLRGSPVSAQPDRTAYRVRKFARRHAAAVAAGIAVIVTVALAAAVSVSQAVDARAQARRATAAVNQQAAVRELYVEAMNTLAATASASPAELARPHAVSHALWETMKGMLGRYSDRPHEREALLQAVMLQLSFTGDFDGALEVGQQYLAHLKEHRAPAHDVIDAHAAVARSLDVVGRSDDAIALLRAGLAWAPDDQAAATQRTRLNIASELGGKLLFSGEIAEAARLLRGVEERAKEAFPSSRERADNLLRLARLSAGADDAAALRYAQLAHETLLASGTANRDATLFSQAGVAAALALNGRLAEAEDLFAKAHALAVETYGRADRDTVGYFGHWVAVQAMQGKHDLARAALQREIEAVASMSSADQGRVLVLLRARGVENDLLFGDIERARAAIAPKPDALLAATHSLDRLRLLAAEARALLLSGDAPAAIERVDAGLATLTPPQRSLAPSVALRLARVEALHAAGRGAEALTAAESIVREFEQRAATQTWDYVVAVEWASLVAAEQAGAANALAALERISVASHGLEPPSALHRAESLLRRARLHLIAGQRATAHQVAVQARDLLNAQHLQSPRRRVVRALLER